MFTHLHVHSEYSLLDGMAGVKQLIGAAEEFGMKSLALTDHGNMFAAVDFYMAAIKRDENGRIIFWEDGSPEFTVKPIIGCEVYVAPRTRFNKEVNIDRGMAHIVLLVKNETGYRNLSHIVSNSYTEGFYYKPRTDIDDLREHTEGLIALSGCIAGQIPEKLLDGNYEGAKRIALEYLDVFGGDNFYLEIQDQGLEDERRIRADLIRLSDETGIPLVATNDIHYIRREDAVTHDVLLCVQTKANYSDIKRMRFQGDEFYMRSEEEMRKLFSDIPQAVDNTERIAERCNFNFDLKSIIEERDGIVEADSRFFPKFPVPDEKSNEEYLRSICEKGLDERYGTDKEAHRERFEYELSVISQMGFADYFLIVWDFIRYARERGITVGPGRGSAAGSIVSYVLKITDVDPIRYGLLFERFLNTERKSMPDIDVDFCIERRGEVIDYVREKYGKNNVAQIITFGTMQARGVIRDIGRAFLIPYGDVEKLVGMIPRKAKSLSEAFVGKSKDTEGNPVEFKEESARFTAQMGLFKAEAEAPDGTIQVHDLMRYAISLEGKPRQSGTHAAGVVICSEALTGLIPLATGRRNAGKDNGENPLLVQYTMNTVENLGFLKMDFLGLRNLTLIRNAATMLEQSRGEKIDVTTLTFDDHKVFKLIASGQTEGVFQLESSGMQEFMQQLQPKCFEDIIVGISMYRPGPMKDIPEYLKNRKSPGRINYAHPMLKPILEETYGVIVYQEQVMRIIRELGGQSYGESDEVRRIMSKKKVDKMREKRGAFIKGCGNKGISKDVAGRIFDQMYSFASYAFNKSHAAVYAVLAYQTAYLKAHYPAEFMAALMSSVSGTPEKVALYMKSARDMGIRVLPPDILKAQKGFSVSDGDILMGLQAVKNVGDAALDEIIALREVEPITGINDFVVKADGYKLNKRAMESLIFAGAFDSICENRARVMQDYALFSGKVKQGRTMPGQTSLFDESGAGDVWDYPDGFRMAMEKEMLGIYFTGHPLDSANDIMERIGAVDTFRLKHPEGVDGVDDTGEAVDSEWTVSDRTTPIDLEKEIVLIGLVNGLRHITIQKGKNRGKTMAVFNLEDYFGEIEVVVFSEVYEKSKAALAISETPIYIEVEQNARNISLGNTPIEKPRIVVVRGKAEYGLEKKVSVKASKVVPLETVQEFFFKQEAKNQGSISPETGKGDI